MNIGSTMDIGRLERITRIQHVQALRQAQKPITTQLVEEEHKRDFGVFVYLAVPVYKASEPLSFPNTPPHVEAILQGGVQDYERKPHPDWNTARKAGAAYSATTGIEQTPRFDERI